MKQDIILAGVGGQGVLSIALIIARAAAAGGLTVRQSEVHGMAQRGGAVSAHLRLSDGTIAGDLAPRGGVDLIVSMEPLESLRYAEWLSPGGALITASEPFVNIETYPPIEEIKAAIGAFPASRIVDAGAMAKEAGSARAVNMVMTGAASVFLPIAAETLEKTIYDAFAGKAEANIRAFGLGRAAALWTHRDATGETP
jgi:indolepyruvate ferredoxin oxidoreductase beta subunit